MRFNLTATVVSLLLQSRASHCSKEDDDKSPMSDFSSFLKQFGDTNVGDIFSRVANGAADKDSHLNYLLDGASENVRKLFETGKPQEVFS